ncbi:M20/M25/M40 family metallo-hydrolase [Halosimplex marinum]|uniref:M20/M25/M40 family metallo-hydrolase n=1 Tax=Halosimplex marinum TaxID=3396620 RepID=UPI003F5778A1
MSDTDPASDADPSYADDPVSLLQELIRFDTSNPPGNERECIEWIADLLSEVGFDTSLYASEEDRPNLVATFGDTGDSPLMLYGHADVVPVNEAKWDHPPFGGEIEDGFVWGRGALDMKGGVAMLLAAAMRVAQSDVAPDDGLVVMIVSDEEGGGDLGTRYMVENHPEIFADVSYAIGEFGGYKTTILGQEFYPIQTNEKIICWSELTFTGTAGHGSMPSTESVMLDMSRAVTAIESSRLPVHIVPAVEMMIDRIADACEGETATKIRQLLDRDQTDEVLSSLGESATMFDALLHNTANTTGISCGDKANVVPDEVTVTLDCRLLPGQTEADLESELRDVIPDDIQYEFDTVRYEPIDSESDLNMFDMLSEILTEADPSATPFPFVLFGASDARHLTKVGVQSYGFLPMNIPEDIEFLELIHSANERIPVEAVEFGTDRLVEAIERYDKRELSDT